MEFNRIQLSINASEHLEKLEKKIGLSPNIICRFALLYSLREPRTPDPSKYNSKGKQLNYSTLLGEWDLLFIALVKQRCIKDGLDPKENFLPQLKAHINRGIYSISNILKSLTDLALLMPEDLLKQNIIDP